MVAEVYNSGVSQNNYNASSKYVKKNENLIHVQCTLYNSWRQMQKLDDLP